jgi:hypothetical protein
MKDNEYYTSFGPEWVKEMSKRKTKELLELIEVKPEGKLSKTSLIQLYRSQCIRDQFNDRNRVGARIKWRDPANKHQRFISCKTKASAEILDGKAVAYFEDGTFKCIEPDFLGTSIYRRLPKEFVDHLIELAPKHHVEVNWSL